MANPFEDLLQRFRQGHAEYGKACLALALLTYDEMQEAESDPQSGFIEWIGSVALESPSAAHCVAAMVFGRFRTLPVFQDRARAAWAVFKPLAASAGANVPMKLRESLPVKPHDAAGIWFTMLYWYMRRKEVDLAIPNHWLSGSVFLDSADMIEVCDLATDHAKLPPRLCDGLVDCSEPEWRKLVAPPVYTNGSKQPATESASLAAESANAENGEAKGKKDGKSTSRQRGRPSDTDQKEDERIADAWKTGQYKRYADLEKEKGLNKGDVKRALDRHRKRKPAKTSRNKGDA